MTTKNQHKENIQPDQEKISTPAKKQHNIGENFHSPSLDWSYVTYYL